MGTWLWKNSYQVPMWSSEIFRNPYGNSPYGQRVIIQAGDKNSNYGFSISHNSAILVEENEPVYAGQAVALSGNSGKAVGRTGEHTHVEIMRREPNGEWKVLSNPSVEDMKALEELGLASKL